MAVEAYNVFAAVTPSNTADLPNPGVSDALWVGGAGTLAIQGTDGQTVSIAAVAAGATLPIKVRRVLATGTTATTIVALYQR